MMDVESQRLAVIGAIGSLWICLGGVILIAAIHDAAIAGQVVNALVALAGTSTFGATVMQVATQWSQTKIAAASPPLQQALAPALAKVDAATAAQIAGPIMQQAAQAQVPNGTGGQSS